MIMPCRAAHNDQRRSAAQADFWNPTGDKWHLDEVFIKINETLRYLWRALDQHGEVLDILVQSRCRRQGDQAVLPPVT
jgi:transposase-like protein